MSVSGLVDIRLTVNGVERTARVEPRLSLADLLRDHLDLTGTHLGCEHGVCGACTVIVDGRTARSCLLLAAEADAAHVTTVEGIAGDGALHPVQQAFLEEHGLQCGFCTPGFVVLLYQLLQENPAPTEADIRNHLGGNICRCTGYQNIFKSALRAIAITRTGRQTPGRSGRC